MLAQGNLLFNYSLFIWFGNTVHLFFINVFSIQEGNVQLYSVYIYHIHTQIVLYYANHFVKAKKQQTLYTNKMHFYTFFYIV